LVSSSEKIAAATSFLSDLNPTKDDKVVFDLLSNVAFMGTDENGMPTPAYKGKDGLYHVPGDLQAAPKGVLQKVLSEAGELIEAAGDAATVFVIPFPRYVAGKCCDNPDHITNFGTDELSDEIHRAMESATAATAIGGGGRTLRLLSVFEIFGTDTDFLHMVTRAENPIWGDDPVHFTPAGYLEVARAIVLGGGRKPAAPET
jgi:hypothetical protein